MLRIIDISQLNVGGFAAQFLLPLNHISIERNSFIEVFLKLLFVNMLIKHVLSVGALLTVAKLKILLTYFFLDVIPRLRDGLVDSLQVRIASLVDHV